MSTILFTIFAFLIILASLLVISVRNPVHSVLNLILVFINSTCLLILLGVEFIGLIILIVYVGAIAILFLFVVMMLNIKLIEFNQNMTRYIPVGLIIGFLFLLELYWLISLTTLPMNSKTANNVASFDIIEYNTYIYNLENIKQIGLVLYTTYFEWLIISSLILLVAMVGAIVLTLNNREIQKIRRQDLYTQLLVKNDTTGN